MKQKRFRLPLVLVLFSALCGAQFALAITTGQLLGRVSDADGQPLPGASVAASSPSQIGGAQLATTNADGKFLYPRLAPGVYTVRIELDGFAMVINYGTGKVRFPNPLKEGDQFRLTIQLGEVTEKRGGWYEAIFHAAVEVEGAAKPACAAECIYRFLPA